MESDIDPPCVVFNFGGETHMRKNNYLCVYTVFSVANIL